MPVTKYIWDDDNIIAEADADDNINVVYTYEPQQYGHLISTRISNTTFYHHFDAIGSTCELTNSAGHVTDTMVYDAWGNIVTRTGTTDVNLLWIGELGYYFDPETGLLSVRARIYGPAIGRWTSNDLLFIDGLNRFVYVANRPLLASDPTGAALCFNCAGRPGDLNCGNFTWPTTFGGMPNGAAVGGVGVAGFIVQKITVGATVDDCNNKRLVQSLACNAKTPPQWDNNNPDKSNYAVTTYWELWYVNAKGVVYAPVMIGNVLKPFLAQNGGLDAWTFTQGGNGTCGDFSISATAYFVPSPTMFTPPGGWATWTYAPGGLPGFLAFSCNAPPLQDPDGTRGIQTAQRSLHAIWVCCPPEKNRDGLEAHVCYKCDAVGGECTPGVQAL